MLPLILLYPWATLTDTPLDILFLQHIVFASVLLHIMSPPKVALAHSNLLF